METKIVVVCKGGLVTAIASNNSKVKIVIVDHDSEDWDDKGELGMTIEGSSCVSNIQKPDAVLNNLSNFFKDKDSASVYVKNKLKQLKF